MIQSVNFPLSTYCVKPFGSWEKLDEEVRSLGLNGIEGIADPDDLDLNLDPALVSGWHMTFYPDWLDFWRHDEKALLEKFHTWEEVGQIYRGTEPEDLMRQFRTDLDLAGKYKPPYAVFHVSDVSLEEGYTYKWLHTDKEVLDGAIDFINTLLEGVEPSFDFLVENQWWPGFTFTDPAKTEYLLRGIKYPRVGIMLDTGHLMNTNWGIRSQADGIRYILRRIEEHGELAKHIYGIHFHQSVSGAYCRKTVGEVPADFPRDYFKAFGYSYSHIQAIDRHRPWTDPDCVRILDRVRPKYLTHEISGSLKRPQLKAVGDQLRVIARGYGK